MRCYFNIISVLSIFWIAAVVSGCATITTEETQSITVTARSVDGEPLDKADCTLINESGKWKVITPNSVKVHRSAKDLMVECKKEGHPDGLARAISRTAPGMWGNIILFAGVGAIIDHTKGTGYNYPSYIVVKMGTTVTVDQRDEASSGDKVATETDATSGLQRSKEEAPVSPLPLKDDHKLLGP